MNTLQLLEEKETGKTNIYKFDITTNEYKPLYDDSNNENLYLEKDILTKEDLNDDKFNITEITQEMLDNCISTFDVNNCSTKDVSIGFSNFSVEIDSYYDKKTNQKLFIYHNEQNVIYYLNKLNDQYPETLIKHVLLTHFNKDLMRISFWSHEDGSNSWGGSGVYLSKNYVKPNTDEEWTRTSCLNQAYMAAASMK